MKMITTYRCSWERETGHSVPVSTLERDQGGGRANVDNTLTASDFNGDGLPDLAVIAPIAPSPWLLFQTGTNSGFSLITTSAASDTVAAGATATYNLAIAPSGGFSGTV